MSDGIKRYIFHDYGYGSADMEEDDYGDYVEFDDYNNLQAEIQRLKRKISDMHFELWNLANKYKAELVITEAAPPQKESEVQK